MSKKKGTLIKVFPIKREINENLTYDSILAWYRDENGVKRTRFVNRSKVPFYILKNKESEEAFKPPMFINKEKVEKIMVYSDMLYREVALRTDSMSYYDRVLTNWGGQSSNMRNILKHNLIYNADMDVADRFIKEFNEEFEPDTNYRLHKTYMDIEVDLRPNGFKDKGYVGFPEEDIAPCPVNAITLIDGKTLITYTYLYDNGINPQIKAFRANLDSEISRIKQKMQDEDGVIMNDIQIKFFDSEEETIEAYFRKIHEIDPDFVGSWNQVFDVKTMMNRLTKIYNNKRELREQRIRGYDEMLRTVVNTKYLTVQDEEGHEVYLSPKAYYKANKDKSIVDRMDTFTVLDGSMWIDQMLLFANVRKGAMRESYSLDAIATEELGKEKLDYSGYSLKDLPWKNYSMFVEYNIRDVLLLHLLEEKGLDFDLQQRLSEITNTRKEKVFKKTISLKNFVCKFAEEQGFVMNNNKNAQYGNDSEYFAANYLSAKDINERNPAYIEAFNKKENYGAYVGDPNLNEACGVKDASGKKSMFIFENVFDEDFSSLYPSIIRAYNLDKNTQVGKFFLLDRSLKDKLTVNYEYDGLFPVSKNDEAEGEESSTDIGPTLVDSLSSQEWGRIGEKYFNLPSTTEMIKTLKGKK